MRTYLASGPWMKNGTDLLERIVLREAIHKNGEVVVHTQTVQLSGENPIVFTNGEYFAERNIDLAIQRWNARVEIQMWEAPDGILQGKPASVEETHAANAADLTDFYRRNPQKTKTFDIGMEVTVTPELSDIFSETFTGFIDRIREENGVKIYTVTDQDHEKFDVNEHQMEKIED